MGCQRGLTTYLCSKGENWVFGSPLLATTGLKRHLWIAAAFTRQADILARMALLAHRISDRDTTPASAPPLDSGYSPGYQW